MGGLVGGLDVGGDAATLGDVVPVGTGPLADRGRLARAPRTARVAGSAHGAAGGPAADLAGAGDPGGECVTQLLGVVRGEVDLLRDTVEGKCDRLVGCGAIEIVNEKNLDLLSHQCCPYVEVVSRHIRAVKGTLRVPIR